MDLEKMQSWNKKEWIIDKEDVKEPKTLEYCGIGEKVSKGKNKYDALLFDGILGDKSGSFYLPIFRIRASNLAQDKLKEKKLGQVKISFDVKTDGFYLEFL